MVLTAHTAAETPLVLTGAASQTADLLDLTNSAAKQLVRVTSAGQIVAPSMLLSSAITPGWAILQLDASPSQAGALLYSQSGAQQWQLYQSPGDTHLYLRDIVNGRMLMTFTPGATTTAAVAEFNGSMQVDGQLKVLGTDASPHLFVFDNGVQGANVFRLYDNAGGVVIMTTHPASGSVVANKGFAVGGNPSFGGGAGPMMFLTNDTSDPSTNPVGGGILYCSNGALKYRGSSGTVTTLGPA